MYYVMRAFAPSLHRESTDSLILFLHCYVYVHEPFVIISITPHLSIIPASLQYVSTLLHCYVYVHDPCVFISITPHLSIIPASLQRVSTLFTFVHCLKRR